MERTFIERDKRSALAIPHLPLRKSLASEIALGTTLIIAAVLRFSFLGHNSLWFDEAFTVWVTQFNWPNLLSLLRLLDSHPPFYYLLMKIWISVAGTGETAIRIPAACFSLFSIGLTFALMRRVSSHTASLLSSFLLSVSPLQVMISQEARMYPLTGALALSSTLALATATDKRSRLHWTIYTLLATLMIYTHYLGFLVLLAHGVWVGCYSRQSLGKWFIVMGVAAVLYAPWVPSLWYQVMHRQSSPGYQNLLANFVDLLGLFAFGGWLFGAASYFGSSTVSPVEQIVLLLPFLVVLWRGALSLSPDRRRLALVGLPPAFTIGAMLALSTVRPPFYVRWFTFLLPFYTMFLAKGIVDLAEHLPARRRATMASALIAGLLLYSVPVLSHYYFDPTFRPYQWRLAAAMVRKNVEPQDLFLYVTDEAKIAFTYYFAEHHPSLILFPNESIPGNGRALTTADIRQLASHYPRVWVISTLPYPPETKQEFQTLHTVFQFVQRGDFGWTWVYFLRAKP